MGLLGVILGQKYKVRRRIGEGGMGTVWEAEHTLIGRRVAIKTLRPEFAHSADVVTRFHREAQAASRIGHVNITEVTDLGITEQGAPYIVMEFLEGEPLARTLERERTLPVTRAADIIGQTLGALAAAHAKGIIHRDLKPENIFLTDHGGRTDFVKLLDFGISKFQSPAGGDQRLTTTGVALGTPYYMAPEQAAGCSDCDHRVDLYAAGALLYEMMTGRSPYKGSNYNALLALIVTSDPPPLSDFRPDLDPAFAAVIEHAMRRNPAERFPDAAAMLGALVPFGARRTPFEQPGSPLAEFPDALLTATPAPRPAADADHPSTAAGEPALHADPGDLPTPSTRPAYFAGAGLLLLALAAGWLLLRDRSDEDPPPPRPAAAERAPTTAPPRHAPAAPGFAPGHGAPAAARPGSPDAGSIPPPDPTAPAPTAPATDSVDPDAGAPAGHDAGQAPFDASDLAASPHDAAPAAPAATADARPDTVRRRPPDDGAAADTDGVIRIRGYTAHTIYED